MLYNDVINFSKGLVSDGFDKTQVWRGEVGRVLVGEAVSANDLLYPVITALGTVAEWKQVKADAASTMPALAIALEDSVDGGRPLVMFKGYRKDKDFNYGTLATGTLTAAGLMIEGDRIVLGEKLNPYCFQMTAAKGTTAASKIAATATLSTTGIGVNAEIITIDDVVFECSTDGVIESTSDYMIDLQVSTAQGAFETAIEEALDQAIADKRLDISYVAFTGNDCVITLGGHSDSYVGLEQNDVVTTEGCTNAAFGSGTFLGGVPVVNYWVENVAVEATQKTLFMAQLDLAIENGLDITYVDFTGGGANDNLVMTAGTDSHKGYKGNNLQMAEVDAAGTLDAGTEVSVGATAFAGGVEGGMLYASTSKGLMTLTKPTGDCVQVVGYAVEADKFFFDPQPMNGRVPVAAEHGAGAVGTGLAPKTFRWTRDDGVIVTEIEIDLTGLKGAGNTARDAIGLTGAAYIGRYVAATYGVVFRIEMVCLELPADCGTLTDIDLEAETAGDIAVDGACSDEVLCATGGLAVGNMLVNNVPAIVANRYLYLTEGTTDGDNTVFTAGQYVIKFYGKPALS